MITRLLIKLKKQFTHVCLHISLPAAYVITQVSKAVMQVMATIMGANPR